MSVANRLTEAWNIGVVMMRRRVMLMALMAGLQPARGQAAEGAGNALETAAKGLGSWLRSLKVGYAEFVEGEKRGQFGRALHELNEALYRVEAKKALLIAEMKRPTDADTEMRLNRMAYDIGNSVVDLRHAVDAVSVSLREGARQGGVECQRLLMDASGETKMWLQGIDSYVLLPEPQKLALIARAEKAVAALRRASEELALLTERIGRT